MIKYRPVRRSISASIKEEVTFSTMEEMIHFLYERAHRLAGYLGTDLPVITIREAAGDDPLTGYRNQHVVFSNSVCIGYCGE